MVESNPPPGKFYLPLTYKLSHFSSLREYYQAFTDLKSSARDPNAVEELSLIEAFLKGLPENLAMVTRRSATETPFTSVKEVYKAAQAVKPETSTSKYSINKMKTNYGNYGNQKHNPRNNNGRKNQQPFHKKNTNFKNNNYKATFHPKKSNFSNNNPIRCEACKRTGHVLADCRDLADFVKFKRNRNRRNFRVNNLNGNMTEDEGDIFDEREEVEGLETDQNGQVFGDCEISNQGDATSVLEAEPVLVSAVDDHFSDPLQEEDFRINTNFVLENSGGFQDVFRVNFQRLITHKFLIKLSGKNYEWNPILDSGAQRSTISLEFAKLLGVHVIKEYKFQVIGFDGVVSDNIVGYVDRLHFVDPISGNSGTFSPIVIDNNKANLCGLYIFYTFGGGKFSKSSENQMAFEFDPISSPSHQPPDVRIKSSCSFKLPPGSFKTIDINKIDTNTDLIISSKNSKNNKISVLDGIVNNNTNKITIYNTNLADELSIQKDQIIANGYEADLEVELGDFSPDSALSHKSVISDHKFLELIKPKVQHIKNMNIKSKLIDILLKHKDVFDISNEKKVGQYPTEVCINPNNQNISVKAEKRRIFNPNVWSQLNVELDKLEKSGMIEDCPFPTISPANLVAAKRKGSDKIRLCVDFRRLNEEISGIFFPLPTKSELFENLGHFDKDAVFIQLDVVSCFWNFKLRDEDKFLTAFYTQDGVKQWKVLPFGVKSAPGIVQHALSSLTRNIGLDQRTSRSHFIDDDAYCIVNIETALTDIEKILSAYSKINLKLKLEKCQFFTKNIFFMGSELKITDSGVKLSVKPENTQALKEMAAPKTAKDLKTFCGMCNWIADYIPNMHLELGPLYNIISKSNKDKNIKFADLWDKNIQKLFEDLKIKLSNPETLSVPDYSKPFELEVDASSYGFGAVLTQKNKIIAYASKALTRQAASYDNSHRETAAVVWSIDKFREFFICNPNPTKIFTDNRVTSYINSSKNNKLKRWRSYLDAHNIEIHHRSGSKMFVSDSLSRLIRDPKTGDYVPDVSDALLDEIVIATCEEKSKLNGIELFQIHVHNGHCGSDRLNKISGEPLDFCSRVIKQCIDCTQHGQVRSQK